MISDLSPGDKLSLKGKIFELQKRLNIIDIETKRNNELSTMFKPTIYSFSLPTRDRCVKHINSRIYSLIAFFSIQRDVLDSINKAEVIRKVSKLLKTIHMYCIILLKY